MNKAITLFILTTLAVFVVGCKEQPTPQDKAEYLVYKLTTHLELNDKQQETLMRLKEEMLTLKEASKGTANTHRNEIKSLILQEHLTVEEMRAQLNTVMQTFEFSISTLFPQLAEFHRTLNPEQKEMLVELIEKHHEKFDRL